MCGGVAIGPGYLLEVIRKAERPESVDPEKPPQWGGLPNLKAPLVILGENGDAWWLGVRPVCQVTYGRNGERSGYASAMGRRRKFTDSFLPLADGSKLPVWVCDETRGKGERVFRLPYPLENREDAMRWQADGLTLAEGEKYWSRFLQWTGAGSMEAVQAVRERWRVLASSRDATPPPWPEGVRIESPKPEQVAETTWTWAELCREVERMKAATGERENVAAGELEAVRGELAKLRGDLEAERSRRAGLEERVGRLAREVAGLRALV